MTGQCVWQLPSSNSTSPHWGDGPRKVLRSCACHDCSSVWDLPANERARLETGIAQRALAVRDLVHLTQDVLASPDHMSS